MHQERSIPPAPQRHAGQRNESTWLLAFFTVCLCVIGGRLFWLQVVNGELNRGRSEENRLRVAPHQPRRGRILDRNGAVLAFSKLTHKLYLWPQQVDDGDWPGLRDRISTLLKIPASQLDARRDAYRPQDHRVVLAGPLQEREILVLEEQAGSLPGVEVDVDYVRSYPHGSLAAHVLGYNSPITEDEYRVLRERGYVLQDRIGRMGAEAAFEKQLRGKWGGQMLEVNAIGQVQRRLGERPSVPGTNIRLTLDLELQRAAEAALSVHSKGAVVALDPRDGAILAMASRPGFDPNFFSRSIKSQQELDTLFRNPLEPMLNRAIQAYDPGSTWKPVTAAAGMESGTFPPDTMLMTARCITYGGHCFHDNNGKGYGRIGYQDALRVSSNTFFYQIGVGSGAAALYDAATRLGFDARTGIEISLEESKGLVGNAIWAEKVRRSPWIPEDIASASIGQAVVQITPLQLARAYAAFANGGRLVQPHLIDDGMDWHRKGTTIGFRPDTIQTIREALRRVVEDGTAIGINLSSLPAVSGKTGTAEDGSGGQDHSWFASYAPSDDPEIVVVAFAQNSPGGGSLWALPMARKVMQAYFNGPGTEPVAAPHPAPGSNLASPSAPAPAAAE